MLLPINIAMKSFEEVENDKRLVVKKNETKVFNGKKKFSMIFDYHDDIVVYNSDSGSEYIAFYQIKTNISNMWTLGGLVGENKKNTERTSNPNFGLSIIAKLTSHVRQLYGSAARD